MEIVIGLLSWMVIANSPYNKNLVLEPKLTLKYKLNYNFYLKSENHILYQPSSFLQINPKTMRVILSIGWKSGPWHINVNRVSVHGLDKSKKIASSEKLSLKYTMSF